MDGSARTPARGTASRVSPRLLAFYLPQFHPTPENNAFWGEGYTEWANVVRARPLFPGHYQPRLPADLGFYDLRLPEVRQAQADLAREHGLHGFVYYHYWFDGRRLLERPFEEVLRTGEPDFPFCLCWANHRWTWKRDHSLEGRLQEMDYSEEDDREHIRHLLEAFQDERYIKVNGRPLFLIYWTASIPDPKRTFDLWREEASKAGVAEPFICKVDSFGDFRDPAEFGCDASVEFWPHAVETMIQRVREPGEVYEQNQIFEYRQLVANHLERPWPDHKRFPCVVPHWDNTARWKATGARMIRNSTPELYGAWLEGVVRKTAAAYDPEEQLVFVNAWNEWGEGTYLEPDLEHGRAYLEATRSALKKAGARVPARNAPVSEAPEPASAEERNRLLLAKYGDLQRRYNEQLAFEERSPLLQKSEQRYEELLQEHNKLRHENGLLERRYGELQRRTAKTEERLARISANQPLVDTERLTTWMRQLDDGIQALLRSSRYRAGEKVGKTLDTVLRRPQSKTSADHLQDVLREFRAWSKRPGRGEDR